MAPPADYYYSISMPQAPYCEPLDAISLRTILHQALMDANYSLLLNKVMEQIQESEEMTLSSQFLPENGVCLHTLYVRGGSDSLREMLNLSERPNVD